MSGGLLIEDGRTAVTSWWRNTLDRRFFTVSVCIEGFGGAGRAVTDDFGNLVQVWL